jgi:hypothetical protein
MLFEIPFMQQDNDDGDGFDHAEALSRNRLSFAGSRAFRRGLIDIPQRPHSTANDTSSGHRSSSIPLPSSHVHRTQSELQLSLDQEVAEQRDVDMFYRLVNGIRDRQDRHSEQMASSSEQSIASIMLTRYRDLGRDSDPAMSHVSPDNNGPHHGPLHMPFTSTDHGDPYSMQEDEAEEWSISGFEQEDSRAATTAAQLAPPPRQDHDTDGEEIFDLDL